MQPTHIYVQQLGRIRKVASMRLTNRNDAPVLKICNLYIIHLQGEYYTTYSQTI